MFNGIVALENKVSHSVDDLWNGVPVNERLNYISATPIHLSIDHYQPKPYDLTPILKRAWAEYTTFKAMNATYAAYFWQQLDKMSYVDFTKTLFKKVKRDLKNLYLKVKSHVAFA